MNADNAALPRHILSITLHDLPSSAPVRIDLPSDTDAIVPTDLNIPSLSLGASFGDGTMTLSALSLMPRRVQFDVENAPAALPLSLSILCDRPFLFGWIQVPGGVQTTIATVAQQIRLVGPGYWAVPLAAIEAAPMRPSARTAPMVAASPDPAKVKPTAPPKTASPSGAKGDPPPP